MPGMRVDLLTSEHDLYALEDEWNELTSQTPDLPIFLSWEWVTTWWRHIGRDHEPWLLTARDADGRLIGIVPWALVQRSIGPIQVRRIEFLSRIELPDRAESLDYGNLTIVAPLDQREAVTGAFVRYLDQSKDQWDIGDFAWLNQDSSLRSYIIEHEPVNSERVAVRPVIPLPDDWETYERSTLGKKRAKDLRQNARRLERDFPGQVVYHRVTERDEVRPAIDRLIEMNEDRWLTIGRATGFEHDAFAEFHRDIATVAFDRGWLRLYQLQVGGNVIASGCRFFYHGTYYAFLKGFDQEWKKYSPGLILQAHEIRDAINEGASEYDMAHGTLEPKRIWTDTERRDVQLLTGNNWRGALFLGKETGYQRAKAVARKLLPGPVYKRVRGLILKNGR